MIFQGTKYLVFVDGEFWDSISYLCPLKDHQLEAAIMRISGMVHKFHRHDIEMFRDLS